MTQPAPASLSLWTASDYLKAILAALDEEFEDPQEALANTPELVRLDFDPRWEVGKPPPGRTDLEVFSIFHGEDPGDVSVYVFPVAPPAQSERSKLWFRYTLNRLGAASLVEIMSRQTFVDELVAEWTELLDDDDDEVDPDQPEAVDPEAQVPPESNPTTFATLSPEAQTKPELKTVVSP